MAGGTFDTQNKVRAGVYIKFKSAPATSFAVGTRGTVAICEPLSWGPVATVTEIDASADLVPITGYALTDPHNRFLQEMFKGTNRTAGPETVLLYRPAAGGAVAASGTAGTLGITANYAGSRGNDITVAITAIPDTTDFTVETIVDGVVMDSQIAASGADLTANAWVTFTGTDTLTATAGVALEGGADGTVASSAYASFLTAIEPYHFDILCYDGTDTTVISAFQIFIERIAAENGQYAQLVAANMTDPDSRFCINVCSGATLDDGTVLTPAQTTWWVAGAEAGALYNESLTYAQYPGAVAVSPVLTNAGYISGINAGQFLLLADRDSVKVESDIDSLTTLTAEIGAVYKKNRVMRLCNQIANDIFAEFSANYIGVINNDEVGRSRFKGAICGYLLDIQANGGIQNFDPDDVEVLAGQWIDAVVITVAIQVVDAAEKIYITVEVS